MQRGGSPHDHALIVDDDIGFSKISLEAITEVSRQLHMNLELSGIDLVRRLREKYMDKEFVFVSAHGGYMRSSMYVTPRAFVRKDHLMADLEETLRVLNGIFRKNDAEISVKDNLRDIRIKPGQIAFMRSEEHYVRICTASGEDRLIRNTLRILETKMREYDFLRIHMRYLITVVEIGVFAAFVPVENRHKRFSPDWKVRNRKKAWCGLFCWMAAAAAMNPVRPDLSLQIRMTEAVITILILWCKPWRKDT